MLSRSLRATLDGAFHHRLPEVAASSRSEDGTVKLTLRLPGDGAIVETVVLPGRGRTTVCISTQVGCARACVFCASGARGLERNASASEILGQILVARSVVESYSLPTLRNVVFMGMGEPLDNLSAVRTAITTLVHPCGFASRRATSRSTVAHL